MVFCLLLLEPPRNKPLTHASGIKMNGTKVLPYIGMITPFNIYSRYTLSRHHMQSAPPRAIPPLICTLGHNAAPKG